MAEALVDYTTSTNKMINFYSTAEYRYTGKHSKEDIEECEYHRQVLFDALDWYMDD